MAYVPPTALPKQTIDLKTLDWQGILQKGAESLATSLGSTIGSGLGQAFLDALLGKSAADDAFKTEVMAALGRIEARLDEILDYLYKQLPAVIRRQVDSALIDQERRELKAKLVTVDGLLRTLRLLDRDPNAAELGLLIQAGNSSLEMGIRLMQNGQEWYAAGLHAYTSGFAAYTKVVQHVPEFGAALATYSREYLQLITPWLSTGSPHGTSFADMAVRLPEEYGFSQTVINPILDKRVNYALHWTVRGGPTVQFNQIIQRPYEFLVYGGWFTLSSTSWSFNGDDFANYVGIPGKEPEDVPSLITQAGFQVSPAWTPQRRWVGMADYDAFVAKLWWALDAYRNHPTRQTQVAAALTTLGAFKTTLETTDLPSMAQPSIAFA
jgi:hypothetical protein